MPSQHTGGRCLSAALDVSPQLSCWLVDPGTGPLVVVDGGGVELTPAQATDLATGLFDLVDDARRG
ncbi:MAG: hypothetical protein ACRC35_03980 [Angustibacter sp.]